VEEKEKQWKDLEDKVRENVAKSPSKITLNVGGKKFATAKSTLLNHKGSYFEVMLSGPWEPDKDGEYFIDRNPKLFGVILDFLRSGKINLMGWSQEDLQMLEEDLDYYQIKISEILQIKWDYFVGGINLTSGEKVATKTGGNGWNSVVKHKIKHASCIYQLKICKLNYDKSGLVVSIGDEHTGISPFSGDINGVGGSGCVYGSLITGKLGTFSEGDLIRIVAKDSRFTLLKGGDSVQILAHYKTPYICLYLYYTGDSVQIELIRDNL